MAKPKDGYYPELMPLFGGRGRINITDGVNVEELW